MNQATRTREEILALSWTIQAIVSYIVVAPTHDFYNAGTLLYQLSYEATQLEEDQFVSFICVAS